MLTGGGGNDTLTGGAGVDTAVYGGNAANDAVAASGGGRYKVTDLRSFQCITCRLPIDRSVNGRCDAPTLRTWAVPTLRLHAMVR